MLIILGIILGIGTGIVRLMGLNLEIISIFIIALNAPVALGIGYLIGKSSAYILDHVSQVLNDDDKLVRGRYPKERKELVSYLEGCRLTELLLMGIKGILLIGVIGLDWKSITHIVMLLSVIVLPVYVIYEGVKKSKEIERKRDKVIGVITGLISIGIYIYMSNKVGYLFMGIVFTLLGLKRRNGKRNNKVRDKGIFRKELIGENINTSADNIMIIVLSNILIGCGRLPYALVEINKETSYYISSIGSFMSSLLFMMFGYSRGANEDTITRLLSNADMLLSLESKLLIGILIVIISVLMLNVPLKVWIKLNYIQIPEWISKIVVVVVLGTSVLMYLSTSSLMILPTFIGVSICCGMILLLRTVENSLKFNTSELITTAIPIPLLISYLI